MPDAMHLQSPGSPPTIWRGASMRIAASMVIALVAVSPAIGQSDSPANSITFSIANERIEAAFINAVALNDAGEEREAASVLKRAYELAAAAHADDATGLADALVDYVETLRRAGQVREARYFIWWSLERYKRSFGRNNPGLVRMHVAAGDLENIWSDARASYDDALRVASKIFGRHSAKYIETKLDISESVESRFRLREADVPAAAGAAYITDIYWLSTQVLPMDNLVRARTAAIRGRYAMSRGLTEPATKYFEEAIESYRLLGLDQSDDVMLIRKALVTCYEQNERRCAATRHAREIGRYFGDQPPLLLHSVVPDYPPGSHFLLSEGTLSFGFTVDDIGFVRDARVLRGPDDESLRSAAMSALLKYRFSPRYVGEKAVKTTDMTASITFEIDDQPSHFGRAAALNDPDRIPECADDD